MPDFVKFCHGHFLRTPLSMQSFACLHITATTPKAYDIIINYTKKTKSMRLFWYNRKFRILYDATMCSLHSPVTNGYQLIAIRPTTLSNLFTKQNVESEHIINMGAMCTLNVDQAPIDFMKLSTKDPYYTDAQMLRSLLLTHMFVE